MTFDCRTSRLLTIVKPDYKVNVKELIDKREREKLEKEKRDSKKTEKKEKTKKIFDAPRGKTDGGEPEPSAEKPREKKVAVPSVKPEIKAPQEEVEDEDPIQAMARMNIPVTSIDEVKANERPSFAPSKAAEDSNDSKKKVYGVTARPAPRNIREKDFETKEDFVDLVAPRGQSGDGITRLNQKYGY